MIQVIVTARRDRGKLTTVSRKVTSQAGQAGEASWEPLCDVIISRLGREVYPPGPDNGVNNMITINS